MPEAVSGVVVFVSVGSCRVFSDGAVLECVLPREIASRQQSALAVGDEVVLRRLDSAHHQVVEVLPRRTVLSRPDPHIADRERAIVANVDVVVLVVSGREPPLRPRLIDRVIVAVERGGARPAVALNKADLLDSGQEQRALETLRPYAEMGVPVVACSARTGRGLDELRGLLADVTSAFVGHSGVGKSSLIEALLPGAHLATSAISSKYGKGRHTTSSSSLFEVPGGGRIIDTPGVREFGLWKITPDELPAYFPEFESHAGGCRFRDCKHVREPDCGVRRGVREGAINRARYETYCRLLGEAVPDLLPDTGGEPDAHHAAGAFACEHCGQSVATRNLGSAHRNHCPHCLWSKHVDHRPGDRSSCCDGPMEPVAVWVRKGGEWAIIHRCTACGDLHSNRIASDDNEALLLSLAVRPLSMPAFPLDRLASLETQMHAEGRR